MRNYYRLEETKRPNKYMQQDSLEWTVQQKKDLNEKPEENLKKLCILGNDNYQC